ncbi:MAG: CRISPR-associated endonuclease Cas3'' [Elusimicrobia bacterium]|nr:CRISPR-associated endonuclease Cas3'' [Elusimicrobiota bacterium]
MLPFEMTSPLAHRDPKNGRVHLLEDHLTDAGEIAAAFGRKFHSEDWARCAARWHDLGKYRPAFQQMIMAAGGENAHIKDDDAATRVDHSSVGAVFAQGKLGSKGIPIALGIAGHHCGLQNLSYWKGERHPRTTELLKEVRIDQVPPRISSVPELSAPPFLSSTVGITAGDRGFSKRRFEFWTRMLFSALVDADFLDTESFYDESRARLRGGFPSVDVLARRLRTHLDEVTAGAAPGPVNELRRQVLQNCREAASRQPGVFSLTVPTGGGKTYASLAFALEHAQANGLDRVIVVAPYLTIIDQTVASYHRALDGHAQDADELVLIEHHSSIDPEKENHKNRLAAENWDATLIVATAVQFFESLFARRPSQCRKLHNLARSVIVIDETQTLPTDFLAPILEILDGLAEYYGSSIVLSTATQPVLKARTAPDGRRISGFRDIVEIAGTPEEIRASFNCLRRVRPQRTAAKDWDEIAALVAAEPRALAITHRRDDARVLAERVQVLKPGEPLFHLSALMCPRHRQERITAVKVELKAQNKPVRVVSTQLVEAGVDFDFPVVFRAMAGLDSLIQSAGRCNREGRLQEGRLVIFNAPTPPPVGALRTAAHETDSMFAANPDMDLFDPEIYGDFDKRLGRVQDKHGVQNLREQFEFESVSEKVKLINSDWQAAVIVPWGPPENRKESLDLLAQADKVDNPAFLRLLARKVQGYSVSIPRRQVDGWLKTGVLYSAGGLFLALTPAYRHLYTDEFGLLAGKETPAADPAALIG